MPTTPAAVTSFLVLNSGALAGPSWFSICEGIGLGFSSWVLSGGVLLSGASVGGFGGVIGASLVIPPVVPSVMLGLTDAWLVGPGVGAVGLAVCLGISGFCVTTGYVGAVVGGSPGGPSGVDASKIVLTNVGSLIGFLTSGFASVGLLGPSAGELSVGLGIGICGLMLGGFGTGVVVAGGVGGATSSKMV